MKSEKRKSARSLRSQGMSIREIEASLGVSRSSVSRWVKDVELSPDLIKALRDRNPTYNLDRSKHCEAWRKKRRNYQREGRNKAQKGNDPLHFAGCMLYWAEGAKNRNVMGFTNSDPKMMCFFIRFLRECYFISDSDIKIQINCYTDVETLETIEEFWLSILELSKTSLYKSTVNYKNKLSTGARHGKLQYGTCRLTVSKTRIVQNIFGAIQTYSGLDNEKWLG